MKKIYPLLALTCLMQTVFGQAPGGITTNLQLWLKSTVGTSTTTNGTPLTSWNYANNGNSFSATGTGPAYTDSLINFKPGIRFVNNLMDGPTVASAPIAANKPDYSMFAVWRSNAHGIFQRIWLQAGSSGAADGFSLATWNDTRMGNEIETSPYDYSLTNHFSDSVWNITQINILNQPLSDQEIVTDSNYKTGPTVSNTDALNTNGPAARHLGNTLNELGSKSTAGNQSLNGDIAEVIVFDRPINTGGEREKIFSYLSLKYGIPLNANLVSSAGATIWDATANASYTNAVFGIARDDASGLLVNRSNSIVTGTGNGTGRSGKGNFTLSNPSALADQGFLLIGNDNGGFTQSSSVRPGAQQFSQKWKVQQSGTTGTVDLAFDLTGLTSTGTIGVPNNFALEVDVDGNGNFNDGTQYYVAANSFTGNVAHFTGVTLNNGNVFTVLSSPTSLPVNWRNVTVGLTAGGDIAINWQVDNNQDGKLYQVEHSLDGTNFSVIGEVANNPAVKSYSYLYASPAAGIHYFRIREVDFDGRSIYSKIVSFETKVGPLSFRVLSSLAVSNYSQLEVTTPQAVDVHLELWSTGGMRISTQEQSIGTGTTRITIPMNQLASGNYVLKIQAGSITRTEKVIKP
ncbi:MAG: T9SS type A sorting domain-containing protein [Chitinophagaceae bacterium]|nr:T9SS type A sorting domain-containing protein [Chitinophagaceae bacterium]